MKMSKENQEKVSKIIGNYICRYKQDIKRFLIATKENNKSEIYQIWAISRAAFNSKIPGSFEKFCAACYEDGLNDNHIFTVFKRTVKKFNQE